MDIEQVCDELREVAGRLGAIEVDESIAPARVPIFAHNAAHGIHSVGDGVSGISGCRWERAEHAIEAAQAMNVDIVTA